MYLWELLLLACWCLFMCLVVRARRPCLKFERGTFSFLSLSRVTCRALVFVSLCISSRAWQCSIKFLFDEHSFWSVVTGRPWYASWCSHVSDSHGSVSAAPVHVFAEVPSAITPLTWTWFWIARSMASSSRMSSAQNRHERDLLPSSIGLCYSQTPNLSHTTCSVPNPPGFAPQRRPYFLRYLFIRMDHRLYLEWKSYKKISQ